MDTCSCEGPREANIHALQGVHGVHYHQALHEVLSFLPHQQGHRVLELQQGPGKGREIIINISLLNSFNFIVVVVVV